MKTLNLTLCLSLLLLVASSCTKEKRIENRLSKNGGEWNIAKYTVGTYLFGFAAFDSEGVANAGTMKFNKNGSMVWTETLNDTTEVYDCTWTNTKSQINIMRGGTEYAFKIDSEERKEMQIQYNTTYVEDGYNYDVRYTLKLEKK